MKKSTFILIGMLLTVLTIGMVACSPKSKLETEQSAKARQFDVKYSSRTTPIITEELGAVGSYNVYSLKKDGVEYIVLGDANSNGGVTVIKHEPKVKQMVNMDSVVTNSKWIPEYTMLGYTQAQPTKQSLESYYNAEKRPIPIGSKKYIVLF
jgi:hypothetical protein